jgi:hypothetical protein
LPTALEAEINSLLLERGDTALVADEIIRRWENNVLSTEEQADGAQFLIACGYFPSFFTRLERLIDTDQPLPWAQLSEAIGHAGIAISGQELEAILTGAREQGALEELAKSRELDHLAPELEQLRDDRREKNAMAYAEKRQILKDKLSFLRANRLLDEEAKIIDEAKALFPADQEFEQVGIGFELHRAREVLQNRAANPRSPEARRSSEFADLTRDLAWKIARLTPEQQSVKAAIIQSAKQRLAGEPRLANDIAVMLHFMDFNAEAVELLAGIEGDPAVDWLRLELLLQARQFVTALDEASRLEVRYAGEPESTFALVYARARALWGLGQSTAAIDLMRSLVRIRPGYKSAFSLLLDWGGGDA